MGFFFGQVHGGALLCVAKMPEGQQEYCYVCRRWKKLKSAPHLFS